jgi:hypothetical protein
MQQIDQQVQSVLKAAPAIAPGAVTMAAEYLDLINKVASIVFLVLSGAFLIWRWYVAKDDRGKSPKQE